jgi:hypothetical protein
VSPYESTRPQNQEYLHLHHCENFKFFITFWKADRIYESNIRMDLTGNRTVKVAIFSKCIVANLTIRPGRVTETRSTHWEMRNACKNFVGKPEGKRPLGRSKSKRKYNMKEDLRNVGFGRAELIHLAQHGVQWRSLVNMVVNIWLHPLTRGIYYFFNKIN